MLKKFFRIGGDEPLIDFIIYLLLIYPLTTRNGLLILSGGRESMHWKQMD